MRRNVLLSTVSTLTFTCLGGCVLDHAETDNGVESNEAQALAVHQDAPVARGSLAVLGVSADNQRVLFVDGCESGEETTLRAVELATRRTYTLARGAFSCAPPIPAMQAAMTSANNGPVGGPDSAALLPDGDQVIMSTHQQGLRLWAFSRHAFVTLSKSPSIYYTSANGSRLAFSEMDTETPSAAGRLRMVDTKTKRVTTLANLAVPLSFAPDGSQFLFGVPTPEAPPVPMPIADIHLWTAADSRSQRIVKNAMLLGASRKGETILLGADLEMPNPETGDAGAQTLFAFTFGNRNATRITKATGFGGATSNEDGSLVAFSDAFDMSNATASLAIWNGKTQTITHLGEKIGSMFPGQMGTPPMFFANQGKALVYLTAEDSPDGKSLTKSLRAYLPSSGTTHTIDTGLDGALVRLSPSETRLVYTKGAELPWNPAGALHAFDVSGARHSKLADSVNPMSVVFSQDSNAVLFLADYYQPYGSILGTLATYNFSTLQTKTISTGAYQAFVSPKEDRIFFLRQRTALDEKDVQVSLWGLNTRASRPKVTLVDGTGENPVQVFAGDRSVVYTKADGLYSRKF